MPKFRVTLMCKTERVYEIEAADQAEIREIVRDGDVGFPVEEVDHHWHIDDIDEIKAEAVNT